MVWVSFSPWLPLSARLLCEHRGHEWSVKATTDQNFEGQSGRGQAEQTKAKTNQNQARPRRFQALFLAGNKLEHL